MIRRDCTTERTQQTTKEKPALRINVHGRARETYKMHYNKSHVPRVSEKSRA